MSADGVCRVCLVNNLNLYGVRNDLQNVYETITREKYNEVGYPVRMCYICLSALRKCHRFMETARDANSSLKQFYNQQCQMAAAKPLSMYSVSEVKVVSIQHGGHSLKYGIKTEKVDLEEPSDVVQTDNQITEDIDVDIKEEVEEEDEMQADDSPICENIQDIEIEVKLEVEPTDATHERDADVFKPETNKPNPELFQPKNKDLKNDIIKPKSITKTNKRNDKINHIIQQKPYLCNICNHKCARQSHLTVHMKTHTTIKPFSCKICSFKTSENSQLTRHLKRHTGEKPYKCEQCNYKTVEKRNLIDHMRTHTGEKPFSCDLCPYKCSRKDNLGTHMKVHTGVKPFVCHICKHSFAHSSNLKQHVLARHKKEK